MCVRLDRNKEGGGILIYIREVIEANVIPNANRSDDYIFEGIFFEVNLRKSKWLMFGGYCNRKANIITFLDHVDSALDLHMSRIDNFLIMGDFNVEISEVGMMNFCETYNVKSLISEPT